MVDMFTLVACGLVILAIALLIVVIIKNWDR